MTPVLSEDGTLYCVGSDALYAISRRGEVTWTFAFPHNEKGGSFSPAIGPNGVIFVASESVVNDMIPSFFRRPSRPGLYALDAKGRILWKYAQGKPRSSPMIDKDGHVYIAMGGEIVMLTQEGKVVRKYSGISGSGFVWTALNEDERTPLLFCLYDDALYAWTPNGMLRTMPLDRKSGWSIGLVIDKRYNLVYALMSEGILVCADAPNLKVKWRFRTKGELASYPAVTDGRIYVGGADTTGQGKVLSHHHLLYAVSHTGMLLWELDLDDELRNPPCLDKRGYIYLTTRSEKDRAAYVYSVTPQGRIQGRVRIAQCRYMSAPILGPDRTVYCYGTRAFAIGEASSKKAKRQGSTLTR